MSIYLTSCFLQQFPRFSEQILNILEKITSPSYNINDFRQTSKEKQSICSLRSGKNFSLWSEGKKNSDRRVQELLVELYTQLVDACRHSST